MEIKVTYSKPEDFDEWNALAEYNGNYVQSTFFDDAQKFYNVNSIYIHIFNDGKLLAGLKLYVNRANKLKPVTSHFSGNLHQFSEFLVSEGISKEHKETTRKIFTEETHKLVKKENINELIVSGLFGPEDQLIEYSYTKPTTDARFNIGIVDIQKTDEEILKSFNRNTKRNVVKGQEEQLLFVKAKEDLSDFFEVMDVVYNKQQEDVHGPNFNYIRYLYKQLQPHNMVDAYMVYKDNEPLSTMFFYRYGKKAYSAFGGTVKNNFGSGQFGYFELMKLYRDKGINEFIFGQIGTSENYLNDKLNIGISNFKRGFSPREVSSFRQSFVFSPLKESIFKMFVKVNNALSRKVEHD